MKLKPQTWTHHHTHRLYHASMLAIFLFAFLFALYGIFLALNYSYADEQSSVAISAVVPEVSPGTSTPTSLPAGGGGGAVPVSPALELFPENYSEQFAFLDGRFVYVIGSPQPVFLGKTNIPDAEVLLRVYGDNPAVNMQGAVMAENSGNFRWQLPQNLPDGLYGLLARAGQMGGGGAFAEANIAFYISTNPQASVPTTVLRPPAETQKFGFLPVLIIKVLNESRKVQPGQAVKTQVQLRGFGSSTRAEQVKVEYFVTNALGKTFSAGSEIALVSKSAAFLKLFYPAIDARVGVYTVSAKITRPEYVLVASDNFVIQPAAKALPVWDITYNYIRVLNAFILFMVLFLLLAYYEYRRVLHHHEQIKKAES